MQELYLHTRCANRLALRPGTRSLITLCLVRTLTARVYSNVRHDATAVRVVMWHSAPTCRYENNKITLNLRRFRPGQNSRGSVECGMTTVRRVPRTSCSLSCAAQRRATYPQYSSAGSNGFEERKTRPRYAYGMGYLGGRRGVSTQTPGAAFFVGVFRCRHSVMSCVNIVEAIKTRNAAGSTPAKDL